MDPNQDMAAMQNQNPAPEEMAPSAPQEPGAQEDQTTPEQKQELLDMMDEIEQKYRNLNASRFANSNELETNRKEMMVEVFKVMKDSGIDVSNVESVKTFLDNLESSNPDLYQIFVDAFNALLGEEAVPEETESAPAGNAPAEATAAPSGLPGMPAGLKSPVASNSALSGMTPPPESPAGPSLSGPAASFPNLAK